jgi:hypothetical protein
MANAKEKGLMLLGSVASVDLNGAGGTETTLYTVPTGKTCIPIMVVLRSLSADPASAVVTIGKTGGDCDEFLGDQTLSAITVGYADECCVLMPVPAATPVASLVLDAAEVLGLEITTAAGGPCTCTADVFGYLF